MAGDHTTPFGSGGEHLVAEGSESGPPARVAIAMGEADDQGRKLVPVYMYSSAGMADGSSVGAGRGADTWAPAYSQLRRCQD